MQALGRAGHEAVVVARSRGVDLTTGQGLDEALTGAEAVIDATSARAGDAEGAREVFGAMTERLLDAERDAGVAHHVLLSIVGVDRLEGNAHYAGKRRREDLVEAGPVPATIQRATQFHEFPEQVAGSMERDGVAPIAPLLLQPVAAAEVMLAGPEARLAPTTFDEWLAGRASDGR